jgi:hypothetical protein
MRQLQTLGFRAAEITFFNPSSYLSGIDDWQDNSAAA